MPYTRQLTSTEKIYVASGFVSPTCANQMIVEGSGVLDKKQWLAAIQKAGEANPGSRLVIKGALACGHWIDTGKAPALREVDGSTWSGMSSEGASFLETPLCPVEGPTCEVVLIHGDPLRIAFRSHHAAMDGRGTLEWALDVFRALRGEPMVGHNSTLTEYSLARSFQNKGRTPAPHHFPALTGQADPEESGYCWQRIPIAGSTRNILPTVALLLAQEIRVTNPGCPVRLAIPVDMRQRGSNIQSTGNLSNLIYLDVAPNDTVESLSDNVKTQLDQKNDGMLYWADSLVRYVPLKLIQHSLEHEIKSKQASGLYRNSGIISNIGKMPVQAMNGGGFQPTNIFWIPVTMEYLPFFSGMMGDKNQMYFLMGMSKKLASRGRLANVMQTISSKITGD